MERPLMAKPVRLALFSEYSAWTNFSLLSYRAKRWSADALVAWQLVSIGLCKLRVDLQVFASRLWSDGLAPFLKINLDSLYSSDFGPRAGKVVNVLVPLLPFMTFLAYESAKVLVIVSLLLWQICHAIFRKGEQIMALVMHHIKGGGRVAERALMAAALLGFSAAGFVTVQWLEAEFSDPKANWAKLDVAFQKIDSEVVPDLKTAGRSALLETKKHGLVRVTVSSQKKD